LLFLFILVSQIAVSHTTANAGTPASTNIHSYGHPNGSVTVTTGAAGPFIDNFNPFSPNASDPTRGMIYEPLFFFDTVDASRVSPWLATSYTWSNRGRALNFTLRRGVYWTDGQPFTSADVAFTFNLIKNYKALNQYGLPLSKVVTDGPYKVILDFTQPVYADLHYIAGLTYIVPKHIWTSIKNPQGFPNTHPVGTGAYQVVSVSGKVMVLTANTHYYMKELPKVRTYRFESFNGNASADIAIESGQIDWAGGYIPNIDNNYLSRNSKFSVSDIPLSIEYLVPNMQKGITRNYSVREALSYAINRMFISKTIYNSYANQTNPESVLLPNFGEILNPNLKRDQFIYSIQQARNILKSAGYTMGRSGYFEKNGSRLTVTCKVVSGYSDYVQTLNLIASQEKAAGIDFVVQSVPYAQFISDQNTGNFQLLIDNFGYTSSPYVFFNNLLDGNNVPPLGAVDTAGDYGRYNNLTIDHLLRQIQSTSSLTQQRPFFYRIESIFGTTLPLIPLFDQQDEQEFNGNIITGEPTPVNPYAASAIYIAPDLGWVAMRLKYIG
jgi:peptide/nickel transport system substrate-binding protein